MTGGDPADGGRHPPRPGQRTGTRGTQVAGAAPGRKVRHGHLYGRRKPSPTRKGRRSQGPAGDATGASWTSPLSDEDPVGFFRQRPPGKPGRPECRWNRIDRRSLRPARKGRAGIWTPQTRRPVAPEPQGPVAVEGQQSPAPRFAGGQGRSHRRSAIPGAVSNDEPVRLRAGRVSDRSLKVVPSGKPAAARPRSHETRG